jgi:hypothetical protein
MKQRSTDQLLILGILFHVLIPNFRAYPSDREFIENYTGNDTCLEYPPDGY